MRKIKNVTGRFAGFLGLSNLSRDFMQFVKVHSFYMIAVNLSAFFVGTFLLKAGSSFETVGLYYVCVYGMESFANFWIPKIITLFAPTTVTRMGAVMYTVCYLLLIFGSCHKIVETLRVLPKKNVLINVPITAL